MHVRFLYPITKEAEQLLARIEHWLDEHLWSHLDRRAKGNRGGQLQPHDVEAAVQAVHGCSVDELAQRPKEPPPPPQSAQAPSSMPSPDVPAQGATSAQTTAPSASAPPDGGAVALAGMPSDTPPIN